MTQESSDLAVPEAHSIVALSEAHARIVVHNVDTLTRSFKTWLKEDVDYTRTLYGRSGKPSLLDPGAQKIRSFFQAYPETTILEHLEDRTPGAERIKYVVRADITHVSGVRIGSGVGSCSTDEAKYQYRWLTADKLRDMGYTEAEIAALPKREMRASRGGKFTVYKIRNPDILDLDNTILKMASKRAEVDATLSLPGVGGVFTQDIDQYPAALTDDEPPRHVEATARVVDPQEAEPERELCQECGWTKPAPVVDSAEDTVRATLMANDVDTEHLLIVRYGDAVRVMVQEGYDEVKWMDDHQVITRLLKGTWSPESEWWVVPAKDLEHLADAAESGEPVYDIWGIDWRLKGDEPALRDSSWAWAFAYTREGDYIPELKPLVQYLEQYGTMEVQGFTLSLGGRDKNLLQRKKIKEVKAK